MNELQIPMLLADHSFDCNHVETLFVYDMAHYIAKKYINRLKTLYYNY